MSRNSLLVLIYLLHIGSAEFLMG